MFYVLDDVEVAPDFFEFMRGFLPLLQFDRSVYCISAWNENGQFNRVSDPYRFYRSDAFTSPKDGGGWMMLREAWDSIGSRWPSQSWREWLQHNDQRAGR
jgi:alpha-1,3-mannosyl-glycoprotein beta-1,2-N-acetylglucosaminyltransferase